MITVTSIVSLIQAGNGLATDTLITILEHCSKVVKGGQTLMNSVLASSSNADDLVAEFDVMLHRQKDYFSQEIAKVSGSFNELIAYLSIVLEVVTKITDLADDETDKIDVPTAIADLRLGAASPNIRRFGLMEGIKILQGFEQIIDDSLKDINKLKEAEVEFKEAATKHEDTLEKTSATLHSIYSKTPLALKAIQKKAKLLRKSKKRRLSHEDIE